MVRWKKILGWLTGLALLFTVVGFGYKKAEEAKLSGLSIHIDHESGLYFLQQAEIKALINKAYPFLDSLRLHEINISLLEESLDNHPSIHKAEVYSGLDGRLQVDVKQKKPIARVMHPQKSYYITDEGDSMLLNKNYSARVPLLTGEINRSTRAALFAFIQQTQKDAFFLDFFSGIHVKKEGTWILYPKAGNLHILLGKYQGVDKKLGKLKTFYQTMVDENMLTEIKRIDLRFTNQVICQKHKDS